METFDTLKSLIDQAGQQMVTQNLRELEIDMNMVLVEAGSEEEKAHIEKGANRLSAHEVGGKNFILFSS